MVNPSNDQQLTISPTPNPSSHSEENGLFTAEVYLIDISYKKPRKVALKKLVTRIGYTAVCDLKLRPPPVPEAEKKVVRYGEIQFIQVEGPPKEESASGAKPINKQVQPANQSAIMPNDGKEQARLDHHHRILLALHPRIRYNLFINRVKVFDSDTDAKKKKFTVTEPHGAYAAFMPGPAASEERKNMEEEKRKKMDEPWPMWSSAPLTDGDDIFCWRSCAGDQSNAVCRFQYKSCGLQECATGPAVKPTMNQRVTSTHPFFSLPKELQFLILSKLNPHDLIASVAPANYALFSLVRDSLLWNKVDIITASWSTPTSWAVLEVLHQICSASVWKKRGCGMTMRHLTILHCPLTCEDVFACVAHSCADLESLVISFKGRQSAKLSGYKLRLFGAKCPKLARLIFEKIGFVTFEDCGPMPQVKTLGLRSCRNARRRIDFEKLSKCFPNWEQAALGPGILFEFGQHAGIMQSIKVLESLSKLTRFWFSWSSFVGVTTRFSFSNLSNLTLLVVENGEDLGDHHLAQIATLQKLQTLGISYGAFAVSEKPTKLGWLKLISDAGSAARARQAVVKEELPNSSVHQLQSLRFRNIKTGFDDDVVRTIASGFASSLKSLDLTGCQKISDWGLTSVVTNCSKLQRLELGENEVLEGTGWLEDLVQRPNFGYLHFTPSSSCGSKHKIIQKIVIPERITSRAADKATAICSDLLFS